MARCFHIGESIEALAADIFAKKIVFNAFLNHPIVGRSSQYKCERDGYAEILKELEPKKSKINESSFLDIGDTIESEKFTILTLHISKLNVSKSTFSHRHNCNHTKTNKFTFGEVTLPFNHIVKALLKKREQKQIPQNKGPRN